VCVCGVCVFCICALLVVLYYLLVCRAVSVTGHLIGDSASQ